MISRPEDESSCRSHQHVVAMLEANFGDLSKIPSCGGRQVWLTRPSLCACRFHALTFVPLLYVIHDKHVVQV